MLDAKMKKTILAIVKSSIPYMNDGVLAGRVPDGVQPRDRYALHCAGIRVGENEVTQNGVTIAKVHYKYAARKVAGAYRITGASIEYFE